MEKILQALLTTACIISVFFLLSLIKPVGYAGALLSSFFNGFHFQAPFTLIFLRIIYKYEWMSTVIITALWTASQIPIGIMQSKLMDWLFY